MGKGPEGVDGYICVRIVVGLHVGKELGVGDRGPLLVVSSG